MFNRFRAFDERLRLKLEAYADELDRQLDIHLSINGVYQMTKLTNEQIEETIAQAHGNILAVQEVSRDPRVIDPCVTRNLRACFTAGVDHGNASMLEKAEQMLAEPVTKTAHAALGRSFERVCDWVDAKEGRSFMGCSRSTPGELMLGDEHNWYASVLLGSVERDPTHKESWCKSFFASTRGGVMAKLAQWCAENPVIVVRAPEVEPGHPDTIPAPALADDRVPGRVPGVAEDDELDSGPAIAEEWRNQ